MRQTIHNRILDSTYAPGDKLPIDEELATELNCARSTVLRAMRELSDEGLVERKRKGGTRVRKDPVTRATLDIAITKREVEEKGSTYSYQLISTEHKIAPLGIAANFGLSKRSEMLRVEAMHLSDSRPYIYEDRWVSLDTVPEISTVDLNVISANEWLVRNKPYSKIKIHFYAEMAGAYYSKVFDCNANDALLVIERTTWLGDEPITSVKAVTMPSYRLKTGS